MFVIGEYQDCPPQDWPHGGQSWVGQSWALSVIRIKSVVPGKLRCFTLRVRPVQALSSGSPSLLLMNWLTRSLVLNIVIFIVVVIICIFCCCHRCCSRTGSPGYHHFCCYYCFCHHCRHRCCSWTCSPGCYSISLFLWIVVVAIVAAHELAHQVLTHYNCLLA